MSMPLARVVARLEREGLLAVTPPPSVRHLEVDAITSDSRRAAHGTIFCAIRGTAWDGHDYLAAAAAAGAAVALVETLAVGLDLPQVVVTNGRRAAAFAAAELHGNPWRELTLIGVTGTNGKTTTVAILRHLLATAAPAGSIGTLGMIGTDGTPVPGMEGLTTPGPTELPEAIRRLAADGATAVAIEVSSHALAQDRVAAAEFAAAIFTNLSRDHLDYHATLDDYLAAKLRLAELIRPGGVIAANADDTAWKGLHREGAHLVRFGTRGLGEVQAEEIVFGSSGVGWQLKTPSCSAPVKMPLFGGYNVYNALGAAAALWGLGWTAERIAAGLADVPQVPGRLERLSTTAGAAIVRDYAHTPDALERALRALRDLVTGRLIVVFGAGGNRDRGKRPEMGRVAAAYADFSIVTTDNPRHEDPLDIAADIEAGMGDAPHLRILDRREAIARAIDLSTTGDLVLLAGKGHETYQVWGDEQVPFDERTVVAEILSRKGIAQ